MKTLLYTQRVEAVAAYEERRDCADQNIARFIRACGYIPVPLPNIPELAGSVMAALRPAGVVLTGGNDLASYGGGAPERDETERLLIESALGQGVPLLGFCRGMQMIAVHMGAKLEKTPGHVGTRHWVGGKIGRQVNSYHNFQILGLPGQAEVLGQAADGVVEAMRHKNLLGIMWHPEREKPFDPIDVALFAGHFDSDSGG